MSIYSLLSGLICEPIVLPLVKIGRQNGIHVSPTVLFDGLIADQVSCTSLRQYAVLILLTSVIAEQHPGVRLNGPSFSPTGLRSSSMQQPIHRYYKLREVRKNQIDALYMLSLLLNLRDISLNSFPTGNDVPCLAGRSEDHDKYWQLSHTYNYGYTCIRAR